jgi:hypothetical protein
MEKLNPITIGLYYKPVTLLLLTNFLGVVFLGTHIIKLS